MVIRKQYDITELGNKVQEAIESCVAGKSNRCSIDLLTANGILEVLRETKVREERHQTLESALSFVEKEDGIQTNEMEGEMNKETPKHKRPSCFKHFYDNYKQCYNTECIHRKECIESTKRTMTECFGCFDEDDIGFDMCDCMEQCKEVTENE